MNDSYKKLAKPYEIWLYILALFPSLIMLVLVFLDTEGINFTDASFTFGNFSQLTESSTIIAFGNSLKFALLSTVLCAILGYFVAYRLFRSKFKNKFLILTILILPMWSNILLRIEALGNVMQPNNIITDLLSKIGIHMAIDIKGSSLAVLIGLVFTYLPFMILPIYTALEKIEPSLEEASLDLGATQLKTFWKVIFPLSTKGIVTGSIMVFLPCLSGFAIPEILGSGNIVLIGNVIDQFFRNMNYNIGALLALFIMILILGAIFLVQKVDKEGETLL